MCILGENSIVIAKGANDLVNYADVDDAEFIISQSKIVLFQNEIPLDVVLHALKLCRKYYCKYEASFNEFAVTNRRTCTIRSLIIINLCACKICENTVQLTFDDLFIFEIYKPVSFYLAMIPRGIYTIIFFPLLYNMDKYILVLRYRDMNYKLCCCFLYYRETFCSYKS